MSRYAPGYTGPMTTAGGVPKGPKPAGTGRDSRPIKPETPGRGRGGMTPPPGMMYGPNDALIPIPQPSKPGKGTPVKPSSKGKTPLSGMGKMAGMAKGGATKKGMAKGGMTKGKK